MTTNKKTTKKLVKILLVDDHQMVRTGLKLMLNQQKLFSVDITEAVDGEEAVNLATNNEFDIILLDVNLPKLGGTAVIKHCKQNKVKTPILAITMHNEDHIVKQVIEAGAHGYLIKNCGIEELTKAISTVLNDQNYYCNEAAQTLLSRTSRSKTENKLDAVLESLTDREKLVIEYVANELTNAEIAKEMRISKRTVEGHRARINTKLQVKNTAGLMRFALSSGIIS